MIAARVTSTRSTPHQRLHFRTLLSDRELPVDRVSVMHRPIFEGAHLAWPNGEDLDAVLCAATRTEMSRLIDAVRSLP